MSTRVSVWGSWTVRGHWLHLYREMVDGRKHLVIEGESDNFHLWPLRYFGLGLDAAWHRARGL